GFHRYATDREWTVPHFEKMLYDNAELPRIYLAGYQLTGTDRYATVARETFAFLDRELSHPEGGFYSTLDAQSERDGTREEGAFYVWTPDEVRTVLEDDGLADRFCARYGVTDGGNFEGRTVLGIDRSVDDIAAEANTSPESVEADLAAAREALIEARAERSRPPRDEKILASWNGLAIQAYAEAGLVLDPSYSDRALEALSFVRDHLWDGDRLFRRFEGGDVGVMGTLDDYAYLARGALTCYEATGAIEPLKFALDLGRRIVTHFHDPDTGALYLTPDDATDLAVRPQDLTDQSTPSAAGVAVEVLLALDHFAPDEEFDAIAQRALDTYRARIRANPIQHASLALAADRRDQGFFELTVVAPDLPESWRESLGGTYLPDRLLSRRPTDIEPWLET
ncbi:MAG: thioredoxin domain-containing protein, partial [Halobacteriales archaeon]|nr:thioredoxin domain-containing protein [Halobacteriales archaeon]